MRYVLKGRVGKIYQFCIGRSPTYFPEKHLKCIVLVQWKPCGFPHQVQFLFMFENMTSRRGFVRGLLISLRARLAAARDKTHVSMGSLVTPSRVASLVRLCRRWAGTRGAWLQPDSRSLLMCSCCRPCSTCCTWRMVLRRLLSTSVLATCSLFTTFFWARNSCGGQTEGNVVIKVELCFMH